MKTFKYLLVAAVAVPTLAGPGFAQTSKPARTHRPGRRIPSATADGLQVVRGGSVLGG